MRYLFWTILTAVVAVRYVVTTPHYEDGQKLRITTRVSSEPVKYDDAQYFKVAGLKVYLPLYPEVGYGDKIIVEGEVKEGKLVKPVLNKVTESDNYLYKLRSRLVLFYQKSLPEPHASLIAGVTIGSKASIPKDFWQKLKLSGTAHVVVASGMNVTLVAGFLLSMLVIVLPRKRAIPFALGGIWLYAVLSGFDAPIIRAAIMGSVALTAQELGRVNIAWRALLISALLMLIIWPQWLTDLGFILSFTATASLIAFEKKVAKLLKKVPFMLKEDLSTTLAAQIGVAPILYFSFGQFNVLSPLINALVLWTIVPVTVIGMVGGIVGQLFEPLGRIIVYLVYPLTLWFVMIVNLMSNF